MRCSASRPTHAGAPTMAVRRAIVDTARARAAVLIREGRVHFQRPVQEQTSQEEIAPQLAREQQGVLSFPAQARHDGQIALEQGARVHVASALDAGVDFFQVAQNADEPFLHELVVIPAVGVARDFSLCPRAWGVSCSGL